jgi:hypothetical protein
MIQANELMIGNWVYQEYNGKAIQIDKGEFIDYPHYFKPIPLTPEILEKIGLKRDEEGWILDFDNKLYDPLGRNGTGGLSQRDTTVFAYKHTKNILTIGVRYLHQLQNLYFALTGEELNYMP